MVEWLKVGKPVEYRTGQGWVVGEQIFVAGDQLVDADGACVLGLNHPEHPIPHIGVSYQVGVSGCQSHVGLGQHLRHI